SPGNATTVKRRRAGAVTSADVHVPNPGGEPQGELWDRSPGCRGEGLRALVEVRRRCVGPDLVVAEAEEVAAVIAQVPCVHEGEEVFTGQARGCDGDLELLVSGESVERLDVEGRLGRRDVP